MNSKDETITVMVDPLDIKLEDYSEAKVKLDCERIKKKMGPRFSEPEKEFLLALIESNRSVIECRETDGLTIRRKKRVWGDIVDSFNKQAGHQKRTLVQLQKCWDNIKTKRKKMLAEERLRAEARVQDNGAEASCNEEVELDDSESLCDVETSLLNDVPITMEQHSDDVEGRVENRTILNAYQSFQNQNQISLDDLTNDLVEKKFSCNLCNEKFESKYALGVHNRQHEEKRLFNCNLCGKSFTQKNNLKIHERVHTNECPFACQVCDKRFSQKCNLQTHMRVHTNIRPYVCNLCKKTFRVGSYLKHHMKLHKNQRDHECTVCGKKFIQKSSLSTHIKSHATVKPFPCDVCDKSFIQNCELKRHTKIHTDDRPFVCPLCKKRFIQRSALKTHQLVHTKERPYVCDYCKRSFNVRNNLRRHIYRCKLKEEQEKEEVAKREKSKRIKNRREKKALGT